MRRRGAFPTTRWSLVLAAREEDRTSARDALASLCDAYWYPIYAFTRKRGHDVERAKDLTQGFFLFLLEKGPLARARPGEGRFRSFLLGTLLHYIAHEQERERAVKRGGEATLLSLDAAAAERRYRLEPRDDRTPDRVFERSWAKTVLDRAERRLREEFERAGKGEQFVRLSAYLGATDRTKPYRDMAAELETSEAAVKMAVRRLRRKFGDHLRDEIAQTVERPEEVDDELRHLLGVLSET